MDISVGKEAQEVLNCIFNSPPVYETLPDGSQGKLVSGYDGFYLYGAFSAGKTVDILTILKFVCMHEKPDARGVRRIKVGVVKQNSNQFIESVVSKIEIFNHFLSKDRECLDAYFVYDKNRTPKCLWRYKPIYFNHGSSYSDETVCEIEFECMSVQSALDADKYKGVEKTIIWFNEMNLYPEQSVDVLKDRKDRYPFNGASYQFWIGDLNPKSKQDWDYKRFVEKECPGVKTLRYESPLLWKEDSEGDRSYLGKRGYFKENPNFISRRPDGYKMWHNMTTGSDMHITNNCLGDFFDGSGGETVHKCLSVDNHVKPFGAPGLERSIIVSVDPGYANGFVTGYFDEVETEKSRTAIDKFMDGEDIFSKLKRPNHGSKYRFNVMDSYYGDGGFEHTWNTVLVPLLQSDEYSDHIRAKRVFFVSDPRSINKRGLVRGDTTLDIISDADFETAVPMDENGTIVDDIGTRLNVTETFTKENRLRIHPRNVPLVTAFVSGYVTKSGGTEPDKKKSGGFAEVMDALQYVLLWKDLGGLEEDYVDSVRFSRRTNGIVNLLAL